MVWHRVLRDPSFRSHSGRPEKGRLAYLPLGEPQLHLAPPLRSNPFVILERAAHDARSDREVAVVAIAIVST